MLKQAAVVAPWLLLAAVLAAGYWRRAGRPWPDAGGEPGPQLKERADE